MLDYKLPEFELFHQSFRLIIEKKDPLFDIYNSLVENNIETKFNFNILDKDVNTVINIAPILINNLSRDQYFIERLPNYYLARDIRDNIYYLCFKNLMIIDIDINNHDTLLNDDIIIEHFNNIKDKSFSIYKSSNGYHVFCISEYVDYRDHKTLDFMINNFCDFYYVVHSFIRGFCVRLNRKFEETNKTEIYKHLAIIDNNNIIKPLLDLTELHYEYSITYAKKPLAYCKFHI
jgi:hypothetical protein